MDRYFKVLQLHPGASIEEIKQAYRQAVRKWHPDLFPEEDVQLQIKAHKMFRSISEAYSEIKKHYQNHSRTNFSNDQPEYPDYSGQFSNMDDDWAETAQSEVAQFVSREWPNGDKYEGMLKNELCHGRGIFTYFNGDVYAGEFRFGKREGEGKLTFSKGGQYVGGFVDDQMSGRGKLIFPNGDHYFGQFANDQFHGEGVLVADEKVYAGEWEYGGLL